MHITGNGSSAQQLRWFADLLPMPCRRPGAVTLPRWVYQFSMLVSGDVAGHALIGWLRWGLVPDGRRLAQRAAQGGRDERGNGADLRAPAGRMSDATADSLRRRLAAAAQRLPGDSPRLDAESSCWPTPPASRAPGLRLTPRMRPDAAAAAAFDALVGAPRPASRSPTLSAHARAISGRWRCTSRRPP